MSCELSSCHGEDEILSLCIKHDAAASTTDTNAADIEVPMPILNAQFEALNLRFGIQQLRKQPNNDNFDLLTHHLSDSPDFMLLDEMPISSSGMGWEKVFLGNTRDEPDVLLLAETGKREDSVECPRQHHIDGRHEKSISGYATTDKTRDKEASKTKNGRFPKWVVEILTTWLDQHLQKPYPTAEEKQDLLKQTGLRLRKLHVLSSQITS